MYGQSGVGEHGAGLSACYCLPATVSCKGGRKATSITTSTLSAAVPIIYVPDLMASSRWGDGEVGSERPTGINIHTPHPLQDQQKNKKAQRDLNRRRRGKKKAWIRFCF
ncbi:unnamed protein product [Lota lota]